MKRKMISILLCLILIPLLALPASASISAPRIIDNAQLLTAEEIQILEEAADQFCKKYSLEAVILTVDSLDGIPISVFADDYYDRNGYGVGTDYSGLILVVAMEERELYISTCGDAINRLSDGELDDTIREISYDLSDGAYYDAFERFFGAVMMSLDYDVSGHKESGPKVNWLLSLAIGAASAGVVILIMKSSMNTKRKQRSAENYLLDGSYDLKNRQDIYLYSNVSKTKREQKSSSSTHSSSSGRSHGGRGGRF